MHKPEGLRFGPLGGQAVHLCVDAQRLFAEETEWHTPWLSRVLPNVERIAAAGPERTVFTRFIPARSVEECGGAWRRYYARWPSMTLDALPSGMVDLVPTLARFVPPARVVDKRVYSPWLDPSLETILRGGGVDTLIISGGETDVCVLATTFGAIDRGYRVIVAWDAICSSADETHDATMVLFGNRFGEQIETASTEEILNSWR